MRLTFAITFVCGAFLVLPNGATPAKAQGACSYQKCYAACTKKGTTNAGLCSKGCGKKCTNP
jgi:hypothetical protein